MKSRAGQGSAADPVARASAIAARLADLGARYDAVPVFPAESTRCLVRAGLHKDFAAAQSGGTQFANTGDRQRSLMNVLRIIGRADLSIGRLFEGHVNALSLIDRYGSRQQAQRLAHALAAGQFYGVWATEPAPGVTIATAADGRHILQGTKSFASGAGGIEWALVTARPEEGERRLVIVAADEAMRTDLSHWRARGMRATGSGHYDLTGMAIDNAALLGAPGDYDCEPLFTAGAWRFAAVQLGGIEALVGEVREAMRQGGADDPIKRAMFARCVEACRTAFLWVRECGGRAASEDHEAPAFALMTRGVVERAGLDVMELAARIVGTRSAMDGQRIDKVIRDLSLYLRQAAPDHARDQAALAWLEKDVWGDGEALW